MADMQLDPTTIISVLALVVSIASAVIAWRTASRQNELQERIVSVETARERDRLKLARSAQVSAAIERLASTDFRLRIANAGNASARNLRVLLDGKPALDHSLILRDEDDVTSLGPGAAVRYILAVTMGSPRVFDVLITWEDDSGEPGKWESQLKI